MKLAIKGHSTRGKEIIEMLEMLGGKNEFEDISFIKPNIFLFIGDDYYDCCTEIGWDYIGDDINDEKFIIYTLEDFLKKYPYKVGDKVKVCGTGEVFTISCMTWDVELSTVHYTNMEDIKIKYYTTDELKPYKETNIKTDMNKNNPLFKIGDVVKLKGFSDKNFWIVMDVVEDGYIFNNGEKYSFDVQHYYEKSDRKVMPTATTEITTLNMSAIDYNNGLVGYEIPVGYEFDTVIDNKVVLKKLKPTYPKTYVECAKILNCFSAAHIDGYKNELFEKLQELYICRDAYWKIAGEEMGLDKPWKPDWTTFEDMPSISMFRYNIICDFTKHHNCLLVFPTKEMRDAFYENFKDLIEQCKELL